MRVIKPNSQFLYDLDKPHRSRHTVFKHEIEQNKKAISVDILSAKQAHLDQVEVSNLLIQLIEQVKKLSEKLAKKESGEKIERSKTPEPDER